MSNEFSARASYRKCPGSHHRQIMRVNDVQGKIADGPAACAECQQVFHSEPVGARLVEPLTVTFTADDFLTLTYDGGKKLAVYLPMFMGTSLTLYIASDGSTFTDAALTMPARLRP